MTTFPTLSQKPSIDTPTEVLDQSLKSEMQNGMKISRARYTRTLRKWSLKWNAMLDTNLTTLLTFYATVKGGSASFQWTDEFGNTYEVRFAGNIKHNSVAGSASAVSCDLEEV